MGIENLVVSFGAAGNPQPITIAEQVYSAMPVGFGAVTQDRWRSNPVTVNGIAFTIFPGLDSTGRADVWIYAVFGEAPAPNTYSIINRESAAVDLQITLNGVAQNLFGSGTTYSYNHQRATWLRWQSASMPWDTSSGFINARITDGTFLRHDSRNLFGSLDNFSMPSVTGYQPFKTFANIDQTLSIGDQLRSCTGGGERTAIGPVHEWFARLISEVGTNNNAAWLTGTRLQLLKDLAETPAQFPHASGLIDPLTNRLLDPSVKPHCSHDNPNAWYGATGIPQPLIQGGSMQDGVYDNAHPFNKISFQAYHLSKDPFHLLQVQAQAVCALTYQSLFNNSRGADGKTLTLALDQERALWWGLQTLIQAWHATPSGTMPKPFRDKSWFASAITNTLNFIRTQCISSVTHQASGVIGEAMRFWRATSNMGVTNGEVFNSHFQEDYGNIVLAQALMLGFSDARDVAEWHAVNIQRRLEIGGSWFLNDYTLESGQGFSGYAMSPDAGTLPYSDVAGFRAWYARKTQYTDGPTVPANYWLQQFGRDTYLFLGAVNLTKEAARRGLMTLGFNAITAEADLRARFVAPYTIDATPTGQPLNRTVYAKQYYSYPDAAGTPDNPEPVPQGERMIAANRVEETSLSTDTSTITLLGKAQGRRAFTDGYTVGTTGIRVVIDDDAGNFLAGRFTLTAPAQLTRESIIFSSAPNNGNVVFPLGTVKRVYVDLLAEDINKMLSADDPTATSISSTATATIPIIDGGSSKQITLDNLVSALGTKPDQLPALTSIPDNYVLTFTDPTSHSSFSVTWASLKAGLPASAPADTTAPTFVSAQVANASPTVIQITMSESLNTAIVPAASAFTVSGGKTVSSVAISGAVVSLTCNAAYANGDTITVTYTKPGSGNTLQDAAGNATASFGPSSVTNNIAAAGDTTAPTASSASVANASPAVVAITMSEAMDTANVPAASAFTVSGHTVSSVAISGSTISLTVSAAFVNGEAARTVSYTQPGTNNARDLAGNLLANFTGLAITNNVAASGTSDSTTYSAVVYSGSTLKTAYDASGASTFNSKKYVMPGSLFTGTGQYLTIKRISDNTDPATVPNAGWSNSNTTPPTVMAGQNVGSGNDQNAATPMNKPGAYELLSYLWLAAGANGNYYLWVQMPDSSWVCVNRNSPLVISGA